MAARARRRAEGENVPDSVEAAATDAALEEMDQKKSGTPQSEDSTDKK